MNLDYERYISQWLEGLYDEIAYWDRFMHMRDGTGEEYRKRFMEFVSEERPFCLEEELPETKDTIEFIDVGSGPFSRCGVVAKKKNLHITALDPLANVYRMMKKENHLENGIDVRSGFVETLDLQFETGSFDVVHMSNALDHSFDPVYGIYQLLNICKIGGKVILRHAENEAEPDYGGLHQWNLSLHNKEHSFVIWHKDQERYDICAMFREYADIELTPDIREQNGTWVYNKVVMTKKKQVNLPEKNYYYILLQQMNRFLGLTLLDHVYTGYGSKNSVHYHILSKKMQEAGPKMLREKLQGRRVILYGMGNLGRQLFDLCMEAEIEIAALIDREKREYRGRVTTEPDILEKSFDRDFVIVSMISGAGEVIQQLKEKGFPAAAVTDLCRLYEYENWGP